MNGCIPNWKMEDDSRPFPDLLPTTNEKRYIGPDNELLELLWRNGQLVLHNQTNCRTLPTISESKQTQKPESLLKNGASLGNSSNFIHEDENAQWFQYPLDNSIEKEFSEFLCGMSTAEPIGSNKTSKEEDTCAQLHPNIDSNACAKQSMLHLKDKVMLPPKPLTFGSTQQIPSADNGVVDIFSSHSKAGRVDLGSANRNFCEEASSSGIVVGVGESSSTRTTLSRVCGSNTNTVRVVKDSQLIYDCNDLQSNAYETLIASSSGLQRTTGHGQKRKGRDAEESEGHSEETGYESADANKPAQRTAYGRRSRAAEVHNLSERRRRDKINEKMKALQELIPHCNKTDKASMLDEAIEYLKSLQLQLQIMWMGNGMTPILFPSLHQYMSLMDIGMGQHSMPSNQNPVQLPISLPDNQSVPSTSVPNQPPGCPPQAPSSVNVPNQVQTFHLPEPYPRYFTFPQMQVPPQVMNMCTNGPHIMQQNQIAAAAEKQQHASIKSSIGQSG